MECDALLGEFPKMRRLAGMVLGKKSFCKFWPIMANYTGDYVANVYNSFMLSPHEIQRYRDLGPEKRYELFLEIAAWAWECLDADGADIGRRRWELIRRHHEEGSRRLEAKFREIP